ncbi:MAG: type I DNA topoisomerase [Candidatus Nomurabacteria bacterium]|jgi:DNA topoisomerase-1|nr:type I DNA topoisomerase [Candidatus Nomurabacteria bacterium]
MKLLIVESPAKAKTIEKYLGKDYKVLSSVGHIRQIADGNSAVRPNEDFAVDYAIAPDKKKVIAELKTAVKQASEVLLATDEDREGEAIAWHLQEVLGLPQNTKRITFHEITEGALKDAVANPRTVDQNMVQSQRARQVLDRLVGFELSPVIWRKVPGGKSAGRVQSPAVRLVVEREREIEQFATKSAYKISGVFTHNESEIPATRKDKLAEEQARDFIAGVAERAAKGAIWRVQDAKKSTAKRSPAAPFTTAALQIEASSKLGYSARTTMNAAQALYQAGLITYHRTDSTNLSGASIHAIKDYILQEFGEKYSKVRQFHTKSKGAQEAHEAIRPTHIENVAAGKNDFEKKLYNLIRRRTLSSQMADAELAKTTYTISDGTAELEATGETVLFDGFLKLYDGGKVNSLPELAVDTPLKLHSLTARQTFDNPPARYTEGSLVKKLEELGIGRPSTYATILTTIQSREYVKKGEGEGKPREVKVIEFASGEITEKSETEKSGADKGKLLPEPIGEILTDFLVKHFEQVDDYGWTAKIEGELDQIADGGKTYLQVLQDFYTPFHKLVASADDIERFNGARLLGVDPKTKLNIYAKIGRKGGFLQLGESEKGGDKPRFMPLPKGKDTKTVELGEAIKAFALPSLPRTLGKIDDDEVLAAAGPFGPYLKVGKLNITIKKDDPYTITLDRAKELVAEKKASILADWGDIQIINGAYGPYVKGPGKRNFTKIPKDTDPKKLTRAEAEELLKNKPAKKSFRRSTKSGTKRSAKSSSRTKKPRTTSSASAV